MARIASAQSSRRIGFLVTALSALRSGEWLTPSRLRGYPAVFLALWLAGAAAWIALSDGRLDPLGRPLGSDFLAFWTASRQLLAGEGAAVYDDAAQRAAQAAAAGSAEAPYYPLFYPPAGLLLFLPLGLLPYGAALALWLAGSGAAYLAVLWRAWRQPLVPYLALAAPAVFVTAGHGQNAFLSGALLGAALLALPRRPLLAGLLIGLLAYKPQLGLALPLALAAGRYWRAMAAAAATVLVVALVATIAFGWEIWPAFLERTAFARLVLEQGGIPFFKLQSLYAALRLLGLETAPAMAGHWALAAAVLASLAGLWWSAAGYGLKAAGLVTAALLVTPFVFDYDLALLGLAIVLLARDGAERGFLPWDKTLLAAAWVLPLLARPLGQVTHLGVAWLVILLLHGAVLRRAWLARRTD